MSTMEQQFNDQFMDNLLDQTAEAEANKTRKSVIDVLTKLNDHLASKEFNKNIKYQAKKYNVNPEFIKNKTAQKYLNVIGETLGLAVDVVGNAMKTLFKLINYVLANIVNIAVGLLQRLFNVLTLRTMAVE